MVNYTCDTCDYSTGRKADYTKHLTTKKHLQKVKENNKIVTNTSQNLSHHSKTTLEKSTQESKNSDEKKVINCKFCCCTFSRIDNLNRHLKTCYEKKAIDMKNELEMKLQLSNKNHKIELLKMNKKEESKRIDYLEQELKNCRQDIEYYKDMLSAAGSMVNKSISACSYIMNKYDDAPSINHIYFENFKQIKDDISDEKLVEEVLFYHDNGNIDKYIAEPIIQIYKKDDPSRQSLWNTDSSRMTYFIKKVLDNNKSKWIVDKKGVETIEFVIDPIIEQIKELVENYNRNIYLDNKTLNRKKIDRMIEASRMCCNLLKDIDNKKLHESILKYITPYFHFKVQKCLTN